MTAEAAVALLLGLAAAWVAHSCRADPARSGAAEVCSLAMIAGLVTARAASTGRLLPAVPIGVIGLAAAVVDAHEGRLPNVLNGVLAAATTTTIATAVVLSGDTASGLRSVTAAAMASGLAVTVKVLSPGSIGWGDVKLLPALAATLAWAGPATLYRGVLAWAALLLLTVAAWPAVRIDRRETVPYGPALVAGALGTLLAAT